MTKTDFVKANPYFSGLSTAELNAVVPLFFEKTAERGDMLLLEGEPSRVLYFVISGVVKVYKTSAEGRDQILYLVRPGGSFIDVPVSGEGTNLASAEAITPLSLYAIKKDDFIKIFQIYPQVARNAVNVLSRIVYDMVALVEALSFHDVNGRVARVLLENAEDTGHGLRLTQQEMAAMAGTVRELVGRSLRTMETEKIIRLDHHRIIITNKKALQSLAGQET
ncbi:MAG: Crp/Fnr family transcriptional regulator [Dehalococcoidales bacterium]|nr:Crp/Fnr family transcriptional regulator [Dehalococcoidales bacterium]